MISCQSRCQIVSALILSLIFALFTGLTQADDLYFVDAHSQIDQEVEDISLVLKRMNENNVQKTILSARGKRHDSDIVRLARNSGGRVIASIRTKGGKYTQDKPRFYLKLEKQSNNGKFGAIAEVIMYHAQKGHMAEEVEIYPSDERVQAVLAAAKSNHWPFVAHIEFAALGRDKRQRYMKEFETLLKENSSTPVLLIHMGQLPPQVAKTLLTRHKNLHFITSHADPITVNKSTQPWVNMFQGEHFKPQWQVLMLEFPDRFVFALDNVWAEHWEDDYSKKMKLWRKALGDLPVEVAEKIAHGNAERLYQ